VFNRLGRPGLGIVRLSGRGENLPKTSRKPPENLPKTSRKPPENLPKTSRKPPGNLPETPDKVPKRVQLGPGRSLLSGNSPTTAEVALLLRHPGLAQTGEISGFGRGPHLWRPPRLIPEDLQIGLIRTWRAALLAQYLVGPLGQRHQVRRRYEPSVFAIEISVADRTGPGTRGSDVERDFMSDRFLHYLRQRWPPDRRNRVHRLVSH
jgi:hypothetical protein